MVKPMVETRRAAAQLSRRRFLALAGSAAGMAGLTAAGCGGGGNGESTPSPSATSPSPTEPGATAIPTPTRDPNDRHGSTLRYSGFVLSGGASLDPHRTRSGPLLAQQALVYSRLLTYANQAEGILQADLAMDLPEQPDAQQYIFRLNPAARWHQGEPTAGRAVTAEDVRFSIERQAQGDLSFVRRAQWSLVESIDTPDDQTVILNLSQPYADLPSLAAEPWSLIVAPDVVESGDPFTASRQIGSGPFTWLEWQEGSFASVARNADWHGTNELPYLDGVVLSHASSTDEVEGALRTRDLDVANVGRLQADRLRESLPELQERRVGQSTFFGMRFFTAGAPYSDIRLRTAISIALDRRAMVDDFFGGSGVVNPWISTPVSRWSLPQQELQGLAGYRPGSGGRSEDIAEANALLDTMRAEGSIPDTLELLVTSDVETSLGMGTTIASQLRENLGLDVTVTPVQITELAQRLVDGNAPWAVGSDTGWLTLDDWVYQYFHSTGSNNSFPIRDPDLDALLEAQRAEMDEATRQGQAYDIQRRLLTLNAGVNLVSEEAVVLSWPYIRDFPLDITDGYQDRVSGTWIDQGDPAFDRRNGGS